MADQNATALRCVIALPEDGRGQAAPSALLAGFNRRQVAVSVVNGAPGVMLALAQDAASTVVVVDPQTFAGLDELIEAVRAYHPGVACWEYVTGQGQAGRLRPLQSAQQQGPDSAAPPFKAEPKGKSGDSGDSRGSGGVGVSGGRGGVRRPPLAADLPSPLVTREELAMLLGQHDPKHRRGEYPGAAGADTQFSPPKSAPEA